MEGSSGENGNGAFGGAICKEANIHTTGLLKEQNKELNGQLSQTPILSVIEKNTSEKKMGENRMYFCKLPVKGSIKIAPE